MKTKILADFQICISVPLKVIVSSKENLKSDQRLWNTRAACRHLDLQRIIYCLTLDRFSKINFDAENKNRDQVHFNNSGGKAG